MKTLRTALALTGALACILLAGCFFKPAPEPDYYVLPSPEAQPYVAEGITRLAGCRVVVGPVTIPGYLDHLPILVRDPKANTVALKNNARWSESLAAGITRVLCDSLTNRLAPSGGSAFPMETAMNADWRLFINIMRFDGAPDAPVALEADWSLTTPYGEVLRHGRFKDTLKAGPELNGMVAAMGRLLDNFGAQLEREISTLPAPRR